MNKQLIASVLIGVACILPVRTFAASAEKDTDKDGLSDHLEQVFGTDPTVTDTDGDGFPDGLEIANGYSPTSTSPIRLTKAIRVKLSTQKLSQILGGVTIAEFPISSGKAALPTPTGTFHILNKQRKAWSHAAKLWMPYWMAFDTRGHGLHELPEWPNGKKEGKDHLGRPVSHGCVRMGEGVAKMLYEWTPLGTTLTIEK